MNESGWDLTHSVLDPELLEAPQTSLKLCIPETTSSSSCLDVGLGTSTGTSLNLLVTCLVVYILLTQLVLGRWNLARRFYRGSHGLGLEQILEEKGTIYAAHLRAKAGRQDLKTEQSPAERGSQQEVI